MYKAYFKNIEDPISSYTHFLGALFSVGICFFWLIYGNYLHSTLTTMLSIFAFGLALIALYSASSYYHTLPHDHKYYTVFRKLDHSMIYVLIVGSYTPFIMTYNSQATIVVIVMWLLALLGIIIKILWFNAPRWLYTGLYLLLGWSIVFMPSIFIHMPLGCLVLVALGGISYTIGGIIYIIKKPNLKWNFHDIFHIFILIGSLFHVLAVTFYII